MNAIGGYLELELGAKTGHYHNGYRLNSARSAIFLIIKAIMEEGDLKGIWLPRFLCPEVMESIEANFKIPIYLYGYDLGLQPTQLDPGYGEIVYWYNLFGMLDTDKRADIVDNAHAFFAKPKDGYHTIYSARKFFGVADGAYVQTTLPIIEPAPMNLGRDFGHLMTRHFESAEIGYPKFKRSEERITSEIPRGMSVFSDKVLGAIDYTWAARQRRQNFLDLHRELGERNRLSNTIEKALNDESFVPYTYPLLTSGGARIREELIANRVYITTLWSGLIEASNLSDFEYCLCKDTVHLPIDQRYESKEMEYILHLIKSNFDRG